MPKPGLRTTYKYSDHFKATAVRQSQIEGVASKDVADLLYIHPLMLSRWQKEMREGKIMAKGAEVDKSVAGDLKELRRIKKDYERLQVEYDLLKKPSSSLPVENRHLRFHPPPQKIPLGETHVSAVRRDTWRLLRVERSIA